MTMLERIARAIFEASKRSPHEWPAREVEFRAYAQAAIDTIIRGWRRDMIPAAIKAIDNTERPIDLVEHVARAINDALYLRQMPSTAEGALELARIAARAAIKAIDNTGSNMAASGHATKRVSGNT